MDICHFQKQLRLPNRIVENYQLFDFKLKPEDIKLIDGLHGVTGLATDPDKTTF